MLNLLLAALAFVSAHFLISSTRLRGHLVARLGARAYAGLFSAQAFGLILWLALAFRAAPRDRFLWALPGETHLVLTLMPFILVLAIGGFVAPNPSAVMQPSPGAAWPPTVILSVTRHPVMCGRK